MPNRRGRVFCNYFYAMLQYIAHIVRIFFSQFVSKLRLMGSPWRSVFYHTTSLSLFQTDSQNLAGASSLKCLTSVIWTLQTTSSVWRRLCSRTLLTEMFHYRQVLGCKANLDWSAGLFKWKKKEHVVGYEHFWEWSSEIFFLLKFWFWIIS